MLLLVAGVAAAPGGGAPRLSTSHRVVVYGGEVKLSGIVGSRRAGETIVVSRRRYGERTFVSLAAVETGAGGAWSYVTHPRIRTAYVARWKGRRSATVSVSVRPRVTLTLRNGGFFAEVVAARSLLGRSVVLQRQLADGSWAPIRRAVLRRSPRRFTARLPRGRVRVRAFLPQIEAGPGYAAGFSRPLVVRPVSS